MAESRMYLVEGWLGPPGKIDSRIITYTLEAYTAEDAAFQAWASFESDKDERGKFTLRSVHPVKKSPEPLIRSKLAPTLVRVGSREWVVDLGYLRGDGSAGRAHLTLDSGDESEAHRIANSLVDGIKEATKDPLPPPLPPVSRP